MESEARPAMHVPARAIPVPASVSPEAQAMLALGVIGPPPVWPDLEDVDAWRAFIAEREAFVLEMTRDSGQRSGVKVDHIDIEGVPVYSIRPDGVDPGERRAYVELHGGGFIQDGGEICCARAIDTAKSLHAPVWAIDYRMAPDHPHPASVTDCVAVYRAMLAERDAREIIIGGPSAGATLAAATILKARDEGLPLPAAAVLISGVFDLTESGDSFQTNLGIDTVLTGTLRPAALLYAGGHDLRDPYLSPLFGDFNQGFPPTFINTGTRDLLLSDNVRFHRALRAAGVPAELHVWEAAGHAMFLGMAPEDQARAVEVRRFVEDHWQPGGDR